MNDVYCAHIGCYYLWVHTHTLIHSLAEKVEPVHTIIDEVGIKKLK